MNGARRALSAIVSATVLLSLAGCAKSESNSQPEQTAETGRWVEERITPAQGLYQIDFSLSSNGSLQWYGIEENHLCEFTSQDNGDTWQREELNWLEQMNGATITGVSQASDGTLLAEGSPDGITKNDWLVNTDDTVRQLSLTIPEEGVIQRVQLMSGQRAFAAVGMPVTGEGYSVQTTDADGQMTTALMDSPTESGVFDLSTGEKVKNTAEYPQFLTFCESSGTLYILNFNGERQCYQLQSIDSEGTLTMLQEELTGISGDAALFVDDQAAAYFANSQGIHKLAPGGSKLETILEASTFTFALPDSSIQSLLALDDGSFIITLAVSDKNGNYVSEVYRYYKDYTTPVPDDGETLSIWSLYNNDTARAAAVQFGAANPSVEVEYTYALEDGDEAGVEDVLRQLNTELLAGQGPDVLILDGVDRFESYAQKGIFADLSSVLDKEALVPSVSNSFFRENETYVFPARFKVPVIFGDAGTVENLDSLEDLRTLIHQWAPRPNTTVEDEAYYTPLEDEQAYAFSFLSLEKLVDFTLQTSMNAILQNGELDEDALRQALEFIADVGSYYNMDEYPETPTENVTAGGSGGDVVISADELQEYVNCGRARFGRTLMTTPLVLPSEGGRYLGGILNGSFERSEFNAVLQPGLCDGAFLPACMVAVNAASEKQDEALEFVRMLLSEDIQSVLYEDEGMPVCQAALDASLARAQESKDWALYKGKFQTLIDELKTPVIMDRTIQQHILVYAKDLAAESISVDDALTALSNELSLYLAEQR